MIATSRQAARFRAARGVLCVLAVVGAMSAPAAAAEKAISVTSAVRDLPADLKTPDRHALIIGASDYADGRIPDLPACANDAKSLHQVLVDPGIGLFPRDNVKLLLEGAVTKENVIDALDQLGRKAGPEDLIVVFFSGHGATDERDRSYWVMADTRIDKLRATALPETDISELLAEIKTKRLVTLIDACYSAATAPLQQTKSLLDLRKIYPKFQGQGRVAITASRGDQLSVVIKDDEHAGKGYSAFTWHVVEGMRGRADSAGGDSDGVVTVHELWAYVKDRTERTSRSSRASSAPGSC